MESNSAHSKTFALQMEKVAQKIRYFPVSENQTLNLKYYLATREFRKELKAQKAKGVLPGALDTFYNHWSYECSLMNEERRQLITSKYLRKAGNLFVPLPSWDFGEPSSKSWRRTEDGRNWYLTNEGLATVREEIEKEQKRRREARGHWVQWVSALTGLIGTITGLIAVLNK